jgi:cobalt-zinc-cadmium resistance protein CzcA
MPTVFGSSDRFTGIEAGIAIPLWFGPYASRSKAAGLKEQVARLNADYYSKSLQGNYRELLAEYSKFSASLDYYEKQALPEARLIIEQATSSYKAGAMDYLDYIITLNRAQDIQKNYLEALNSYNQTIINIEFISGKIF